MFQSSVLKNFSQDEGLVAIRWVEFQNFLGKINSIKGTKEEIEKLKNDIEVYISEIDNIVYKLYELTEDEIKVIEGI